MIDDLVKLMTRCINNEDFVYGEQCDPRFLLDILTKYLDYNFHDTFPNEEGGPFEFHFDIVIYIDFIGEAGSVDPPDPDALLYSLTEDFQSQLSLTMGQDQNIQQMVDSEMNPEVEIPGQGKVVMRKYITSMSNFVILAITRNKGSSDGMKFSNRLDHQRVPINMYLYLRGGDIQNIEKPGGVLIYRLSAVVCHIGTASQGHYLVYIMEENRFITVNDLSITITPSSDLITLERHCVLLLYQFEQSVAHGEEIERNSTVISEAMFDPLESNERIVMKPVRGRKRKNQSINCDKRPYQRRKRAGASSYKGI